MKDSEKVATTMDEIMHPGITSENIAAGFPDAPSDWSTDSAKHVADKQNVVLTEDHFDLIRALHQYFARHQDKPVNLRELHDALDEKFHKRGGLKFLYEILPGGPVAQGCEIAGLKAPAGAKDVSYGSVV